MRVLYCGDGPIQGPAGYLYCVLKHLGFTVDHLMPDEALTLSLFKKTDPDCLILSDYSFIQLRSSVSEIVKRVHGGMGLLMVGGWGSFYGGGYAQTEIEKILPVTIRKGDDRLNYSPGLRIYPSLKNEILKGLPFDKGPVICGLNKVSVKRRARVILAAHEIKFAKNKTIGLSNRSHPLLAVQELGRGRAAAMTTDFAPHWSGGLLDWGTVRRKISIPKKKIAVEVGNAYIRFIGNLVNWLTHQ